MSSNPCLSKVGFLLVGCFAAYLGGHPINSSLQRPVLSGCSHHRRQRLCRSKVRQLDRRSPLFDHNLQRPGAVPSLAKIHEAVCPFDVAVNYPIIVQVAHTIHNLFKAPGSFNLPKTPIPPSVLCQVPVPRVLHEDKDARTVVRHLGAQKWDNMRMLQTSAENKGNRPQGSGGDIERICTET
jgi:hypothetical protein